MPNINLATPALGCVNYATNTWPADPLENLTDGSDSSEWSAQTTPVAGKAVWFDLNAIGTLAQIRLKQSTVAGYAATQVTISTSEDGVGWASIATVNVSLGNNVINLTPVASRWWRISAAVGGGARWYIAVIELLGTSEPADPAPQEAPGWLDYIEANYVPTMTEWLQANGYWPTGA